MRGLKWKLVISSIIFGFVVFYIEVLSYVVNSKHWAPFPVDDSTVVRVLLVADPQLIGENNEVPFLGLFTRWDADRYIQRNFMLANYHVQPHVVVFLGDLFDEGSDALDAEYRRYLKRFREIFGLPRPQDPTPGRLKYIFIPGDNDVGGEGMEPVDPVKVKWFNQTFGDFRKDLVLRKSSNVRFIKMNLILPEEYQNPLKDRDKFKDNQNEANPEYRILLSHTSLLQFKTDAVQSILDELRPQLIFSAHSHLSSYGQMEDSRLTKLTHNFLHAHNHQQTKIQNIPFEQEVSYNLVEEDETLQSSADISIHLSKFFGKGSVHEISVPTSSYRMGVPHAGFGAFTLYKNGTLNYTVLWLPSRFKHLYLYLGIYFVMKISIIFLLTWKFFSWLMKIFRRNCGLRNLELDFNLKQV